MAREQQVTVSATTQSMAEMTMSMYDPEATPDFGGDRPSFNVRWSPLQRELLEWLRKHAPSLAEPYVAAVTLLQAPEFPGRKTLVCFCARDLGNILPQARGVDEGAVGPGTLPKSDELKGVKRKAKTLHAALQAAGSAKGEASSNLAEKIHRLMQWIGDHPIGRHQDGLEGARRKAKALLRALTHGNVPEQDAGRWIDEVYPLQKWFSDHHHFSQETREWPSDGELEQNFERFEHALLRFTHTFFGLLERAEETIEDASARGGAPENAEVDHLVAVLDWSPEFHRPLLESLDARWVQPLHERGLFADPPPAVHVEGRGVQCAHWPASKYLARMAPEAPAEVAAIFAAIGTDNGFIIGDMLDGALAMPPDVATSLVPTICQAANEGTLWIYFRKASDLCARLAKAGEADAAMKLADALFTPTFDMDREAPSRRDEFWYKEGLKEVVPALVKVKPREFLPRLCDWLKASVDAKSHSDPESGEDYSYIWRPAIEEHQQNPDYDFAGAMVGRVRQGFEQAIRDGCISLADALSIVEAYPYLVFKRLRLHLIGEFAGQDPELARKTMLDHALFVDYQSKHEYAMLMEKCFGRLESEEQEIWFGRIDAGPNKDEVDPTATEEQQEAQANWWRFKKLHWVRAHVKGKRRAFYEEMRTEHGEPEFADISMGTTTRWGSESPMSVADLAGKTFAEAVNAVSTWQPNTSRFMGPSIDGLASTFGEYVATNPTAFSRKASVLIGKPAVYVRKFISQMPATAKDSLDIDIPTVLKLCAWVVQQPREQRTTPQQEDEILADKDWQWTRDEISRFVGAVCKAKSDDAPRYPLEGLEAPMWELLAHLCQDPPESHVVHDKARDDPRLHDYQNLGINSSRGIAVEAALEYARWVRDHIKQLHGEAGIIPGGFDPMAKVREMLEWQIAPPNRTVEALSVIGSRMGAAYGIDKEWLKENAEKLFYLKGRESTPPSVEGWAAWNAFLVWVPPHIEFYRMFEAQFAYAVAQAAKVKLTEQGREQPMCRLGEHLMILYGRGQLALDDDDKLLRRFLDSANPDIRRHSVGFVGRTLKGDEELGKEIVDRFMALWELYWSGRGKADAKQKPDAWLFGPWFSCGRFDGQWALERLEEFTGVVPLPEPDHAVAKRLAEVAHIDLPRAVGILDRMIRADREQKIHGWLDSAKTILEQAMGKTSGDTKEQAIALINVLGRRGHTEFGKLLGSHCS